jgi:hypothetical protein
VLAFVSILGIYFFFQVRGLVTVPYIGGASRLEAFV